MSTSDIKNYFNGVLGDRLRCLLPSFWFKRMFNMTLDKIDDVDNKVENIKIELPTSRTIANWGFTKNKGTVTSITAGEGINTDSGNPITDTGTISLKPANKNSLGGVKLYNIRQYGPSRVSYDYRYEHRNFGIEADSTNKLFVTVPPETFYGECDTAANFSIKTVPLVEYVNSVKIRMVVKFTNANTAANPSLDPGNGQNKPIYFNGAPITEQQYWSAGAVVEFYYDGSYYHMLGAVNDTDTTIAVDTVMTASSTNPVQNKVVKEYIDNAVVTPVESVTSTVKSIEPNKYYKWTSAISSLTITLATPANTSILNNYMFEFTTSSSGCTLNVPSKVKWANGEAPTIEASKTYQVSIINNLAVVSKF